VMKKVVEAPVQASVVNPWSSRDRRTASSCVWLGQGQMVEVSLSRGYQVEAYPGCSQLRSAVYYGSCCESMQQTAAPASPRAGKLGCVE
jgi:hypothetical protein